MIEGDFFLASYNKVDFERLVLRWNDRLTHHVLQLNLDKTELFKIDPNGISIVIVRFHLFDIFGPLQLFYIILYLLFWTKVLLVHILETFA